MRFGLYEANLAEGTLHKNGRKIKVQDQPFRLLVMLLQQPGKTVTRERLKEVLWSADTFVDFDHSLNATVAKLRQALDDSADNPRFIETLARRGYRFIAPVELPLPSPPVADSQPGAVSSVSEPSSSELRNKKGGRLPLIIGVVLMAAALSLVVVLTRRSASRHESSVTQLTFGTGLTLDPALSPDGKLLAYASDELDGRNLNICVKQMVPGGGTIQLTHEDAGTRQPSFSPDGAHIFFHCAKDGGGVCVIPTIGGEIVRLAPRGMAPHVSPDGKWVSFQIGFDLSSTITGNSIGQSYVMPAAGGAARRIGADLQSATNPVWSPDGKHVLVYTLGNNLFDWFLVSTTGGRSRRTGLFDELKRQGFSVALNRIPHLSQWYPGFILFSATLGDAVNVWRMPVSDDGTSTGVAQRLTSGAAIEASPVLSANGDLIFTSLNALSQIWSLPIDPNTTVVRGQLTRLTSGPYEVLPSVSLDGKFLAFTGTVRGRRISRENAEVRLKDLERGAETVISGPPQAYPEISKDGSFLATETIEPPKDIVRLLNSKDLALPRILGAGHAWDWSRDNKQLLLSRNGPAIQCLELVSGKEVFQIADPKYDLDQGKFAPGERFVAVGAIGKDGISSRVFIVPVGPNMHSAEDWIAIDHSSLWDDKARWSPDGNLLYFVSDRDGHLCLWAQRLNGKSKQPLLAPFPVWHFHNLAFGMQNVGVGVLDIDVAQDKVVLGASELTGNLWSVKVP